MAMKKQLPIEPEEKPEDIEFDDEKEEEQLNIEDFIEIGGSPVPGVTLRKILHGDETEFTRIAWSPDGRYLASISGDKTIRIWDVEHEECIGVLKEEHSHWGIAWSPIGDRFVTGSSSGEIKVWKFVNSNLEFKIVDSMYKRQGVMKVMCSA